MVTKVVSNNDTYVLRRGISDNPTPVYFPAAFGSAINALCIVQCTVEYVYKITALVYIAPAKCLIIYGSSFTVTIIATDANKW